MYRTFMEKTSNGQEIKKAIVTGRLTNNPPAPKTVNVKGTEKLVLEDNHFAVAVRFIRKNDREDIVVKQDGEGKELAYIKVKAWEKTAELLSKYGKRGQEITIIGRPQKETYQGNEYCSITVDEFELGARSQGTGSQGTQATAGNNEPTNEATDEPLETSGSATELGDGFTDDIPF